MRPTTTRPVLAITFASWPVLRHFGVFGKNGSECFGGWKSKVCARKKIYNLSVRILSWILNSSHIISPLSASASEQRLDAFFVVKLPLSAARTNSSASSRRLSVEPLDSCMRIIDCRPAQYRLAQQQSCRKSGNDPRIFCSGSASCLSFKVLINLLIAWLSPWNVTILVV